MEYSFILSLGPVIAVFATSKNYFAHKQSLKGKTSKSHHPLVCAQWLDDLTVANLCNGNLSAHHQLAQNDNHKSIATVNNWDVCITGAALGPNLQPYLWKCKMWKLPNKIMQLLVLNSCACNFASLYQGFSFLTLPLITFISS